MTEDNQDNPVIQAATESAAETSECESLVEKPTPRIGTRLVEIEGDDPESITEVMGIKPERRVPDLKKPWMDHHKFTLVQTVEHVNQIVDECIKRGSCSLDLETEGLDNRIRTRADGLVETVHQIVGICISYDGFEGFYIPVRHKPNDGEQDLNVKPVHAVEQAISRLCHAAIPEGTPEAKEVDELSYKCEQPKIVIYFWNAQFDHEFLYPITGIDWWHPASFEDGILACYCIYTGDNHLSLKDKAKELLRDPAGNPYEMIKLKELFHNRAKDIAFQLLAPDEPGVLRYGGSDAICTYKLCTLPELVPVCHERHMFTYRLEKQTSNAARVMERSRVKINRPRIQQMLQEWETAKAELLKKVQVFSLEQRGLEVDPNSPKQMSEFLFGPKPRGLDITPKPEKNEASGQYKTDAETLEELATHRDAPRILKDVVKFREAEKMIGTYLRGLAENPDENDEIRVSFKQTGAASGRFSAPKGDADHGYAGIPAHGIPKESDMRRCFMARDGYTLVKADYAAEELRIAANVAGERTWIDEFTNGTGDLHTLTARALFGKQEITKSERGTGKTLNFCLLYGGGQGAIRRQTGCDEMEAKRLKMAFDKAVPTFTKWAKEQHRKVKQVKGVYTAFGRWLALPDALDPRPAVRAAVERHSVNYTIQGSGADIMKIGMVLLTKKFHKLQWLKNGGDDSVRMLLTLHDELVFEVRNDRVVDAIPVIVDAMEFPWKMAKWKVPLVVEPLLGFNWKSGYACERARTKRHMPESEISRVEDGIPLRAYEVLANGFIYSTTREFEKGEALDVGEVLAGNVFRIANPPWLQGINAPAGKPPTGNGHEPSGQRESQLLTVDESSQLSTAERPLAPIVQLPSQSVQLEGRQPLVVRIAQLHELSAQQICNAILNTTNNNEGRPLQIADATGFTLIPVGRFWVDADRFIAQLRYHGLLCEADFDDWSQAN